MGAISIIFLSKGDISERSIIITRWGFGIITMVCVHNMCTYFEVLILCIINIYSSYFYPLPPYRLHSHSISLIYQLQQTCQDLLFH